MKKKHKERGNNIRNHRRKEKTLKCINCTKQKGNDSKERKTGNYDKGKK